MKTKELRYICKYLTKNIWNMDLDVDVKLEKLNDRFGEVVYDVINDKPVPKVINFSRRLITDDIDIKFKLAVIKHELCHYAFCKKGLPFMDDDEYFINELKRIGTFCKEMPLVGYYYTLRCSKCNNIVLTDRNKISKKYNNYRSSCCETFLKYSDKKEYIGKDVKVPEPIDKSILKIEEELLKNI